MKYTLNNKIKKSDYDKIHYYKYESEDRSLTIVCGHFEKPDDFNQGFKKYIDEFFNDDEYKGHNDHIKTISALEILIAANEAYERDGL